MSLDERQEQQLLALPGRMTDVETNKAGQPELNALESLIKAWVNLLIPIASSPITLGGNYTVRPQDPALIVLDANGGNRTVFLPRANKGNKFYVLLNVSS